jgi:hypothetical protein
MILSVCTKCIVFGQFHIYETVLLLYCTIYSFSNAQLCYRKAYGIQNIASQSRVNTCQRRGYCRTCECYVIFLLTVEALLVWKEVLYERN